MGTDVQDERITLQVFEEVKTCMIGKPKFHLKPKQEKEVLCNFTKEFSSKHMFSSENARHENLRFLPTAVITHNELPIKLQPHCPSDYKVQTFKYINMDEQVVAQKPNGEMIIQDPEIQRDYKNGDFLELDEERLPEGLNNITRVKRSEDHYQRCLRVRDDTTLHPSNALEETGCFWVRFACRTAKGCPGSHVFYSCKHKKDHPRASRWGCEYILLCATMTQDSVCALHVQATDMVCDQCCISDNCGTHMPRCSGEGPTVDVSTRKLTMRVNIRKFNPDVGDY